MWLADTDGRVTERVVEDLEAIEQDISSKGWWKPKTELTVVMQSVRPRGQSCCHLVFQFAYDTVSDVTSLK